MQQERLGRKYTLTKELGTGFSAQVRQAVADNDPQ